MSKLGCDRPGAYEAAGQYRDESGVSTSSIKMRDELVVDEVASESGEGAGVMTSPNSNLVSARMTPLESAYSAARL